MKGKTVREQQSICPCSETCPIGDAVRMIGGRWKMRILCALTLDGTLRYNDLRKRIAGITPAVLSAAFPGRCIPPFRKLFHMPKKSKHILTKCVILFDWNECDESVHFEINCKGEAR